MLRLNQMKVMNRDQDDCIVIFQTETAGFSFFN